MNSSRVTNQLEDVPSPSGLNPSGTTLGVRPSAAARMCLGTAQAGMRYGIANQEGQPPEQEVRAWVNAAVAFGVTWFDTAAAYGESEAVLGRAYATLGLGEKVN